MKELPYRQIHLDFHTSPYITDVGTSFDAEKFVKTLKEAKVNSVNVFAKCHHGLCYYPTKIGRKHPALKFDLLGEILKVLHREGIAAPIYFPVGWEEVAAENFNWLELSDEGILGQIKTFEDRNYKWRKLCLNKKGYIDYVLAQTKELLDNYEVDGFWYDIIKQDNCVCNDCIKSMKELGLDPQNKDHVRKHDFLVLRDFQKTVYEYVRESKPTATIFFNGTWTPDGGYDSMYSIHERSIYQTHIELESLPSDLWGYNHFPLFVNYHNRDNAELVGMNGKFHTAWGDFGSLRNIEALEYECFRMIANGCKCSIGDQMHPRAYLDETVYKLIGEVYTQVEEREQWCRGTQKVSEIGILIANKPLETKLEADDGAMRMMLELHYCFDFIDYMTDFSRYKLIILPDNIYCNKALSEKISEYIKNGGKIIASYHSGLDPIKSTFALEELGVEYIMEDVYCPSYLLLKENFFKEKSQYEYVLYEQGANVRALAGTETLAELGKPYFNRSYDCFCSHRQFPFDGPTGFPAITKKRNVIYISHPLFTDYIKNSVRLYREIIKQCIEKLLEKPLVITELPVSAELTLRRQGNKLIMHAIHYIAERKAKNLDIVDTKIPLYKIRTKIRTDKAPKRVYIAPLGTELEFKYEGGYTEFVLPEIFGYQIAVLEEV